MSGVPRSQRLLAWNSVAGNTSPAWQSPTGFITLVKAIDIVNAGAAPSAISVYVRTEDGAVTVLLVNETVAAGIAIERIQWCVLNPGDVIYCAAQLADVRVWISGAVLAGPPQFPPATRELPTQEPHG